MLECPVVKSFGKFLLLKVYFGSLLRPKEEYLVERSSLERSIIDNASSYLSPAEPGGLINIGREH